MTVPSGKMRGGNRRWRAGRSDAVHHGIVGLQQWELLEAVLVEVGEEADAPEEPIQSGSIMVEDEVRGTERLSGCGMAAIVNERNGGGDSIGRGLDHLFGIQVERDSNSDVVEDRREGGSLANANGRIDRVETLSVP